MTIQDLPAVNASLNGVAACFLLAGWLAIRVGKREKLHRAMMVCALVCSALFLACYLYYHLNVGAVTRYEGEGILRAVYFLVLFTHIPLAGLMVPFILAAVWFALRGRFQTHRRIARWVWPVWMYVSVTGVVIYLMLYRL